MSFARNLHLISDDHRSWLRVNHKFMRQISGHALYQELMPHCKTGGAFLYIDATGPKDQSPAHRFLRHLQNLRVPYLLKHEPRVRTSRIHSMPTATASA